MIHKREGFTWVELVVIVLLIIVIAAIIFPIFARCVDPAQQTRCLNNLKQMACAIEMYEDDYDGMVLPWSIGKPGKQRLWTDLMDPYLRQMHKGSRGDLQDRLAKVYRCPSEPEEVRTMQDARHGMDYGYNPYLTKSTAYKKVLCPAMTIRITESAVYDYDVHNLPRGVEDAGYRGGSWCAPMPKGRLKDRMKNPQAPGWHAGHNDVLWVDGHVSSIDCQRVMYTDNYGGTTDPNVWCRLRPKEGIPSEE